MTIGNINTQGTLISKITGKFESIGPSQIYINVNGLEYEIQVSLDVITALKNTKKDSHIQLYTHHHFRENEQKLFGFLDKSQKIFFQALLNLRGFGPSLALSLLSHLRSDVFLSLCRDKNLATLCRIPRVGKGTAESIIFEVNRQAKKWEKLLDSGNDKQSKSKYNKEQELALNALLQLGYREKEAELALHKVTMQSTYDVDAGAAEWIRSALQIL